jgi:hypothetical protein
LSDDEILEVNIHASNEKPIVVEIEAEKIAEIIMRVAHVRERLAVRAANEICDYLAAAHAGAPGVAN